VHYIARMWPTPVRQPGAPGPWAALDGRARVLAMSGIVALVVATAATAWISARFGQPSTPVIYGTGASAGAVWTWDGAAYTMTRIDGAGPSSNDADMAYDPALGALVLWDHGCGRLVMGFTGGCTEQVNRTWTWDGRTWTARPARSSPVEDGHGAMLSAGRLGGVVYVNGAGRAWAWTGGDWRALALPGAPRIPSHGSAAMASTFAAGYDEGRGRLVLVLSTATWTWDGAAWNETAGGIDPAEARPDAHVVYDRARGELVYVGSRRTWTWDGAAWRPHDQPDIASGTLAYDAARRAVVLVQADASACDRSACRTATWTWDGRSWTRVPIDAPPALPLMRSGAFPPPLAFDESRNTLVLFASAA